MLFEIVIDVLYENKSIDKLKLDDMFGNIQFNFILEFSTWNCLKHYFNMKFKR